MQAPAGLGLGLKASRHTGCCTQGLKWLLVHAPINTLLWLLGTAVLIAALAHAERRRVTRLQPPLPAAKDTDKPKEAADEHEEAAEQLLQVELVLNDMLRHCAPSRRHKLVGAAWRLRKPGRLLSVWSDQHNKTRLVAKLPALDICPLWQVIRFLNQTGITIPPSMHSQYLRGGEASLLEFRADVATFGRTWQCVRFMHCMESIRNQNTRIEAVYGLRMLMAPSLRLRSILLRRKEELRRQLLADTRYAGDLPQRERQFVESGRLAEEVLFTSFIADRLWWCMKAEEIKGREEQLRRMHCKSNGGTDPGWRAKHAWVNTEGEA